MKRVRTILTIFMAVMLIMSCFASVYAASGTPAKVKGLSLTSRGQDSINIRWNKAKGAKKYKVYISTVNKSIEYTCRKTTKSTKAKIKGFKGEKTLWVKVRAINGKRKGKYSKVLKVSLPSEAAVRSGKTFVYHTSLGSAFQVTIPDGFEKDGDYTYSCSFNSGNDDITLSADPLLTLNDYKNEWTNGKTVTYNGVTGYEFDANDYTRVFAFEISGRLHTVEVSTMHKYSDQLIQTVLNNIKIISYVN